MSTIVVTGATEGIGKETARNLVEQRFDVVLAVRDGAKGERVAAEIAHDGRRPAVAVGDLADLASVRDLAGEIARRTERVDVLLANAGGIFSPRELTADGLERTFQVNHVGHFLLTRLLEPRRVVAVSSEAHRGARLDLDDLARREQGYSAWGAYCDAKLCNALHVAELARRGAQAVSLHPGFVRTKFGQETTAPLRLLTRVAQLAAISSRMGAQTSIFCATAPRLQTGAYYAGYEPRRPSPAVSDAFLAGRLWSLSEELVAPYL